MPGGFSSLPRIPVLRGKDRILSKLCSKVSPYQWSVDSVRKGRMQSERLQMMLTLDLHSMCTNYREMVSNLKGSLELADKIITWLYRKIWNQNVIHSCSIKEKQKNYLVNRFEHCGEWKGIKLRRLKITKWEFNKVWVFYMFTLHRSPTFLGLEFCPPSMWWFYLRVRTQELGCAIITCFTTELFFQSQDFTNVKWEWVEHKVSKVLLLLSPNRKSINWWVHWREYCILGKTFWGNR